MDHRDENRKGGALLIQMGQVSVKRMMHHNVDKATSVDIKGKKPPPGALSERSPVSGLMHRLK